MRSDLSLAWTISRGLAPLFGIAMPLLLHVRLVLPGFSHICMKTHPLQGSKHARCRSPQTTEINPGLRPRILPALVCSRRPIGVAKHRRIRVEPVELGDSPREPRDLACGVPFVEQLRISAIVDACFSLIVDGVSARSRTRRGCAQAMV